MRTTSMPTPRPAAVVTSAAVLKPGRKISSSASRSDSAAAVSGRTKPWATACRRRRSASMPRPSSATSTTTNAPRWLALSVTVPAAGLPRALRSSGVSRPCTTAFCTRCSSGSTICSMMLASSSTDSAARLDANALAGGAGRLLALPHEARVHGADRHQPGAAEPRPHLAGEPMHEAQILPHGAAQAGDLRLHLGDVGGDLGHAPGEQREVVVAVELQLGEQLGDRARRHAPAPGRPRRARRDGQPRIEVAPLEVGRRPGPAGPGSRRARRRDDRGRRAAARAHSAPPPARRPDP